MSEAPAKKKTSNGQLNILVDFISEHRILVHGKTKPSEANSKEIEKLWDDLTIMLNSCGSGPAKTKIQWRKTFIDWKCHTRKKARDIVVSGRQTGGGEGDQKQLTNVEQKLMAILTWVTVKGNEDVQELGLVQEGTSQDEGDTSLIAEESDEVLEGVKTVKKRSYLTAVNENQGPKRIKVHAPKSRESALQKVVETYAAAQKKSYETAEITSKQELPLNFKTREQDLKEFELKIRYLEAKNKQKELELKERELVLKEREADVNLKERELLVNAQFSS